jgi:hypothetical protein
MGKYLPQVLFVLVAGRGKIKINKSHHLLFTGGKQLDPLKICGDERILLLGGVKRRLDVHMIVLKFDMSLESGLPWKNAESTVSLSSLRSIKHI